MRIEIHIALQFDCFNKRGEVVFPLPLFNEQMYQGNVSIVGAKDDLQR
jgi:hypothetical protein